jgi:hypothetical protein
MSVSEGRGKAEEKGALLNPVAGMEEGKSPQANQPPTQPSRLAREMLALRPRLDYLQPRGEKQETVVSPTTGSESWDQERRGGDARGHQRVSNT